MLTCATLEPVRAKFKLAMLQLLPKLERMPLDAQLPFLLDPACCNNPEMEKLLRNYTYALHETRTRQLLLLQV